MVLYNSTFEPEDIFLMLMSGPLYYSVIERTVAITGMITMLVFGLAGNALVIFFIVNNASNRTPYLATIACFALSDFISLSSYYFAALYVSIVNNISIFKHAHYNVSCAIQRMVMVPASLSQTECIGLIAIERYLYFGHPYLHQRWVTVKRVLLVELTVFVLSFFYQLAAVTLGRSYYSLSMLWCSILEVKWYFLPTMMIWIDIPAAVTLVIVIKLTLIIAKKRRQISVERRQITSVSARVSIAEALPGASDGDTSGLGKHRAHEQTNAEVRSEVMNNEYDHPSDNVKSNDRSDPNFSPGGRFQSKIEYHFRDMAAESSSICREDQNSGNADGKEKPVNSGNGSSSLQRQAQSDVEAPTNYIKDNCVTNTMATAVKLIGCISLSYWLTYVPCLVVLHKMLESVSLMDLELGRSPKWHFLLRYFFFFGLCLSTTINPVFHFYFNKSLNRALLLMFRGCKRDTGRRNGLV